jgi:hypothetical protein
MHCVKVSSKTLREFSFWNKHHSKLSDLRYLIYSSYNKAGSITQVLLRGKYKK